MIRRNFILLFLIATTSLTYAQQSEKDSLTAIINKHYEDTAEVNALKNLGNRQKEFDSAIKYLQSALELSQKLNYKKGETECLFDIMNLYYKNNGLGESIEYTLKLLNVYKEIGDYDGVCNMALYLQGMYRDDVGDFRKALNYSLPGKEIAISKNVKNTALFPGHRAAPLFSAEIANTYLVMNEIDSALFYTNDAILQN